MTGEGKYTIDPLEENRVLIMDVADGNPGALTILMSREGMWFSNWLPCIRWLQKKGIRGSAIWEDVKDNYKMDIRGWFQHQIDEMMQEYSDIARKEFKLGKNKVIFD